MGSAFTAVVLTSLIILTVAVITVGATPPDRFACHCTGRLKLVL